MIYGLYHSAAGMLTNEYRQAVLANNIANAETVGFKREVATFAEREPAWRAGERHGPSAEDLATLSGGLGLGRTFTDYRPGTMAPTGNPLDIALDGPGFLAVEQHGEMLYTRDGRLTMQRDGLLVAAIDGAPVLGKGGVQIRLNPYGGQATIDSQGYVSQDGAVVGQLELVDFENYLALTKVGANRFLGPVEGRYAAPVRVHGEYVEQATVEPVTELVTMMEASRAYQVNARMITMQDESLGRLIAQTLRA